ncbi:MAG: DPP IV N-terminal domain-containing protein, partial [Ilumatobacteraceae bacterium]
MDLYLDRSVDRPADTFPRQYARTQRLTLGEPRDLTITHGGSTVVFARSRGGSDPVNCLWSIDIASGVETLLADPVELLADVAADRTDLPPEERARRERLREGAGGVTAYSLSDDGRRATFALAGLLFVTDLATAASSHVPVTGTVFDPRLSPDGERIAYVQGPALWSTDLRGNATLVASEAGVVSTVRWGSADFVAAEEMGRHRGHWWGPDSRVLAVCRVDDAPVPEWFISDPADPSVAPVAVRYPSAGSPNPVVTLHLCRVDGSAPIDVTWDGDALPYLAKVQWNAHGLAITVQRRDQRSVEVRRVDPVTGSTTPVWVDHDDAWVELVPGTGVFVDASRVVVCADRDGARRLVVGGDVVSPADIQVRGVVDADADRVVVVGNPIDDATVQHVYRWRAGSFEALTDVPGVHTAVASGDTTVIRTATLDQPRGQWMLPNGTPLPSVAERPLVRPLVTIRPHHGGTPAIAVLFPTDHGGGPLPVLLDPYGGPHAQRTVQASQAFFTSQWFADQGFAVVVA